jgi:phosphatidylserine decarboxylase
LVAAAGLTVAVAMFQIVWLTWGAGALALFVFWFFRDPERRPLQDERLILSPADGRVVGIAEAKEERFLKDRAVQVSVFLSPLNVHVNRIPCSGKVREAVYQKGQFRAAMSHQASIENEQNAILLETEAGKKIVFVQIAGFLARRIVCWIKPGDAVEQGMRFGMIRFGSRMDLFLPPSTRVMVKVGDRVKAGLTVIGEWSS